MEMVEIIYSAKHEKSNAIADMSGSWKDFKILRQDILKFLESDKENFQIKIDKSLSQESWDFVLESLEINQKGKAVKVSVAENRILQIKASKENLEIFADWLDFDEDNASGYHSHYEYFEGNKYIDSESMPLIIRIK